METLTSFDSQQIANVLQIIQDNGFVERPKDDPLMLYIADSRLVDHRPYYEKPDDQEALRHTILQMKEEILMCASNNDFSSVIQLALSIKSFDASINQSVWISKVKDLRPWIRIFENEPVLN